MTKDDLILAIVKEIKETNQREHKEIKDEQRRINKKLDETSVVSTKKLSGYAAIITASTTLIAILLDKLF